MDAALIEQMAALEDDHWWFVGRAMLVTALVEQECERRGGRVERLVDVGSGTGRILERLSRLAEAAVGVEVEGSAVSLARARGLDVRSAPADALPFEDGSVDLVTCFDVLEHLDDDVAAVREVHRILRPGGAFVFSVPAYSWLWSRHDDAHQHRRRYTERTLRATVAAGGLHVRSAGYLMTLLFPLAVAERVAARLHRRAPRGLSLPRSPLNAVLLRIVLAERRVVLRGGFPFGLSAFGVAERSAA